MLRVTAVTDTVCTETARAGTTDIITSIRPPVRILFARLPMCRRFFLGTRDWPRAIERVDLVLSRFESEPGRTEEVGSHTRYQKINQDYWFDEYSSNKYVEERFANTGCKSPTIHQNGNYPTPTLSLQETDSTYDKSDAGESHQGIPGISLCNVGD